MVATSNRMYFNIKKIYHLQFFRMLKYRHQLTNRVKPSKMTEEIIRNANFQGIEKCIVAY